jgi:hypothetical protein
MALPKIGYTQPNILICTTAIAAIIILIYIQLLQVASRAIIGTFYIPNHSNPHPVEGSKNQSRLIF